MNFSEFEAIFVEHSWLRLQKPTKKYGKMAKKPLLGLVLTGPIDHISIALFCIVLDPIWILICKQQVAWTTAERLV